MFGLSPHVAMVGKWGLGIWKHRWYDGIDDGTESSVIFHVGPFTLLIRNKRREY